MALVVGGRNTIALPSQIPVRCRQPNLTLFMKTEQSKIDKLVEFKQKEKFSTNAWNDRGLNPSSDELCEKLTQLFNLTADNLINDINASPSSRQLKATLKQELSKFKKLNYDTEEKEFICDLFQELAIITNVDFKDELNKWLYGSVLTTLLKIKNVLIPDKIVETIKQPCTNCGTQLETNVMQKEIGIPEYGWYLVKCKNCQELNLISCGTDIKEIKFGNYDYVEGLEKTEYTYEQALVRLEQIKFFRK
jgi:hypothetical protein